MKNLRDLHVYLHYLKSLLPEFVDFMGREKLYLF